MAVYAQVFAGVKPQIKKRFTGLPKSMKCIKKAPYQTGLFIFIFVWDYSRKEKKARVEDALHATRAAVEEGIVAGGGVALLRTRAVIAAIKGENHDQDAGVKIVLRAIEEPLRQIVYNAGVEPSVVVNNVASGSGNYGYNAANETYGDLVEMGVLDPTKVTRSALQNAASVAGLMLTTEAMIAELPKEDAPAMGGGGMGDMGGMGGMM